jgi:hypothetical protein
MRPADRCRQVGRSAAQDLARVLAARPPSETPIHGLRSSPGGRRLAYRVGDALGLIY